MVTHFLQIILLLPLAVVSMKEKVENFIVSNAFAIILSFSLPLNNLKSFPFIKDLSFDQPDEYLRTLGWNSGSVFVINLLLFFQLIGLLVLHILSYIIYNLTKKRHDKLSSYALKIYRFFTFSAYIRIFLEVFLFTIVMLLSEIKYYFKNGGQYNFGHGSGQGQFKPLRGNYVSFYISCILLALPFLFLLLVFISWKINRRVLNIDHNWKTRELYKGILEARTIQRNDTQESENKRDVPTKVQVARLYTFVSLVRKLLMVFLIVLIPDSLCLLKISILIILQTVYLVYGIFKRSFDECKDQLVEIINEFVFLVLITILIQYRYEPDWNDTSADIFIGIILSQLWILLLISIISSIIKLARFIQRKKTKSNREQPQSSVYQQSENENFSNASILRNERSMNKRQVMPKSYKLSHRRTERLHKRFEDRTEGPKW